jgi:hypothetical protein
MTAVEYIFEQLEEQGLIFLTTKTNEMTISISASDYLDIKRLAKEMEKQQIIDAWIATDNELQRMSAEQYYNETYGSKGSDDHIVDTNEMVLEEDEKTNSQRFDEFMQLVTSSQTEISDEEIEYGFEYFQINTLGESQSWESIWKEAIKWYREQLKNKQ